MEALDKMFGVTEAGSDVNTEVRAGVATFLTMAYILSLIHISEPTRPERISYGVVCL